MRECFGGRSGIVEQCQPAITITERFKKVCHPDDPVGGSGREWTAEMTEERDTFDHVRQRLGVVHWRAFKVAAIGKYLFVELLPEKLFTASQPDYIVEEESADYQRPDIPEEVIGKQVVFEMV